MGQKHGFCRRVKRGWGSKGKFLGPKGPLFCFESCTSHSPSPSILVMGLLGGEHGCSQRGANEKGKWKIKKRSKHWDGTLTMRLLTGRTDYMPADRVGWDNEEIWKLKVLATIPHFNFHFFPHLLIFLQFRDPSYVLNSSTKAVLQKWHI